MPISTNKDQILTLKEAAKYLKYSEHTVRTYIQRKLISAQKFGMSVAIPKSECDRFLKEKRNRGRPVEKR